MRRTKVIPLGLILAVWAIGAGLILLVVYEAIEAITLLLSIIA